MNSDHSDEIILADPDPLGTISAMAIDPADSKVFYVTAGEKDKIALFVSTDAGKTWTKKVDVPGRPRRIWVDPQSAEGSRTLYMASAHDVFVASPSGVKSLPLPATANETSLGFGSAAQPTVYTTSEKGAFVSTDGGANWKANEIARPGSEAASDRHQPASSRRRLRFLRPSFARWQELDRRREDDQLRRRVETRLEGSGHGRQEYPRCLDHRALRTGMGREPAGHDSCGSGPQRRVWNGPRPHHAHQRRRGYMGVRSTPAE